MNTVAVKVWGDFACFTRPEMKVERVSYPLMTPSAARGVLEAIFWEPQMYYLVHEIAVVKKGGWVSFRRNEVQSVISLSSAKSWMKGSKAVSYIEAGVGSEFGTPRNSLVLREVEYLITAEIRLSELAQPPKDNLVKYREKFAKRAGAGKCFYRPYLGCREFAADFELVEDPAAVTVANWPEENLGLMLFDLFDHEERKSGFAWKEELSGKKKERGFAGQKIEPQAALPALPEIGHLR
ncbi:MAG: type I-C CRISPR-associated protein Cas5c, partial [bacterium]